MVLEKLNVLVVGLKEVIDIILILGILFLVVIILKIVEKELKIKLILQKKDRNRFYKREISKLRSLKEEPEKILDKLNSLSRDFFKESFNMPYSLEYSELIDEFRKINKRECISFCKLITEANYSGEKINERQVSILINLLTKITENNKILSAEQKLNLEKKAQKQKIKQEKKRKLEQTIQSYKNSLGTLAKIGIFFKNMFKKFSRTEKPKAGAKATT